jgi:3-deoxy-D-arabino-heptulosonate 7-phosphate (DAHP) synthase
METNSSAAFSPLPVPTTFIVNVIHAHSGKQEEAFAIIQDVVHYVAERKEGFLWSILAKSTDGQTVVNIEAIQAAGHVDEFFSDPIFAEKFDSWTTSRRVSSTPIPWVILCCPSAYRRSDREGESRV